jgi:predicted small lipoprotein YifL
MQTNKAMGRRALLLLALLLPALLVLTLAGCGRRDPQAEQAAASAAKPAGGPATAATVATTAADSAAALDLGPRALETVTLVAPLAATGELLFDTKGCTGCHEMGTAENAPDLRGIAARRTEAWLHRQITAPTWMAEHDSLTRAMVEQYGVPMADLNVTNDEAMALVQYLVRENSVR